MNIAPLDAVIIVLYLVGIATFGIMASHKRHATTDEYFLAGRSLKWPMVGAALFATNISTIHLVGLAADGYRMGLVVGNFEWMASFCLVLLALVFAPIYFRSRISTLPEFLEKRFSPGSRTAMAFIAIAGALLIHIGFSLYAGAVVFKQFLNIDPVWSILIISVITAIYTVLGGLKAVVVTEAIQTALLLLGAVLITFLCIRELPEHGINSIAQFKEAVKAEQLSMLQTIKAPEGETFSWVGSLMGRELREYSWLAILLGYPILGIWYWCTDQTIVQRLLGSKTEKDAQYGALFAGFLKILPVFLMVLPGVIAYVLFSEQIGDDNDQAFPTLIMELVPVGLKGLIIAGMLAALMSTIAGALNSCATVVAVDIVKRIKPDTPDDKQVLAGRVTAVVVMILAMMWSTQGGRFESIFQAINAIPMAFAPSITCVFLMGVFWPRGTKEASLYTLIIGFAIGFFVLFLDLGFLTGTRLITEGLGIPFMLQGPVLFAVNVIIFVGISLATPAPPPESIENLCWKNPLDAITHSKLGGVRDPRAIAGILLAIMIVLYIFLH